MLIGVGNQIEVYQYQRVFDKSIDKEGAYKRAYYYPFSSILLKRKDVLKIYDSFEEATYIKEVRK